MRNQIKTSFVGCLWLCTILLFGWLGVPPALAEAPKYDVIHTADDTFKNVTVQSKTATHINILHSTGFASIKVGDLPPEIQAELGYDTSALRLQAKINSNEPVKLEDFPIDPELLQVRDQVHTQMQEQLSSLDKNVIIASLCIAFATFLFFSYCCHLIVLKTGRPGSPAIWFPVIQVIPLLRAAGMSLWWFVLLFLPALSPLLMQPALKAGGPFLAVGVAGLLTLPSQLMWIIWCFKICRARGVSPIWGVMLLLPLTNLISFLYLAFSGGSQLPPSLPRQKGDTESYSRGNQDTSFFYQAQG